jgi:hypothetical protein
MGFESVTEGRVDHVSALERFATTVAFLSRGHRRQRIATVKKDEGARYAIEVDGVVRTHRDDSTIALGAAVVLRGPRQQDGTRGGHPHRTNCA